MSSQTSSLRSLVVSLIACLFLSSTPLGQTPKPQPPATGKRYNRLVIRNAMIIDGNGTPASGPKDIVIENNVITEIAALDPVALKEGRAKRPAPGGRPDRPA